MIVGVDKELCIFLQAVLAGNLIYLAYSVIRVIRRLWKHNLFFVSIEDLVFWIATGIFLFIKMYQTSVVWRIGDSFYFYSSFKKISCETEEKGVR